MSAPLTAWTENILGPVGGLRAELTEAGRSASSCSIFERIRRCSAETTRHRCKRCLPEALPHRTSRGSWVHQRASGGRRRTRPVGARAAERLPTSRAQDDHFRCGRRAILPADRDALRVVARDLLPIWRQRGWIWHRDSRAFWPLRQTRPAGEKNAYGAQCVHVRSAQCVHTSSVPRSPPRVAELRVVGHGKAVFLRGF